MKRRDILKIFSLIPSLPVIFKRKSTLQESVNLKEAYFYKTLPEKEGGWTFKRKKE